MRPQLILPPPGRLSGRAGGSVRAASIDLGALSRLTCRRENNTARPGHRCKVYILYPRFRGMPYTRAGRIRRSILQNSPAGGDQARFSDGALHTLTRRRSYGHPLNRRAHLQIIDIRSKWSVYAAKTGFPQGSSYPRQWTAIDTAFRNTGCSMGRSGKH